jgi:D-alanyl-lipoteichoic acid acyltransferase DltB (MBOAT superfamily)
MAICSLQFLALFALLSILFQLVPRVGQRQLLFSAANICFLIPFVPNAASWAGFAIFIVGGFLAAKFAQTQPSGYWLRAILTVFLAAFLIVKRYVFLSCALPAIVWDHPLELVGLSYMLFKFIHVLVDAWQGQLGTFGFFSYANYQLAFFTLTAGPIQRFNDFDQSWQAMDSQPEDTRETLLAWSRVLTGMFKMGVVATLAHYAFENANDANSTPLLRCVEHFYGYAAYLYFNFSGYTDIAIGCGRILGFHLPENFNRPYLARNIIDFWNRWHMSLTHWIRDYVFMTSYKAAAERFPAASKYIGYVLIFLSLFLAGVWHGSTLAFAAFGVVHGLGAAVNQAYGDVLKARLGRAGFSRYLENPRVHALAVFATFNVVCASLALFSQNTEQTEQTIHALVGELLAPGNASSLPATARVYKETALLVILAALVVGFIWKSSAVIDLMEKFQNWSARSTRSLYITVLVKIVVIVLSFVLLWAVDEQDPVVVYIKF